MRPIDCAICSCGGEVKKVDQTEEERRTYNCHRGCCGLALQCEKCNTRFCIMLESPEMD